MQPPTEADPGCLDTCGTSMGFDRFRIDRAGGETFVMPVGFVEDSSKGT